MDIESFISLLGVDWKREGRLYKICCPFHDDNHPSLVVYPQDRGFYCYPCGVSGTWQYLYKTIKNCDFKEAYEVLQIDGDYEAESRPHPRFDFVDSESGEIVQAVNERYAKCLPLDSPEAAPGAAFLEKKHLLEEAKALGWRWDTGNFIQSKPYGALVIPYHEDGKIVTCRLRRLEPDGTISKPRTLRGVQSRPYILLKPGCEEMYLCEGETDALSLYASGCSVVAVPGVTQKRCINTAVLCAELSGAKRIISCGDNDHPGQQMNEYVKLAAQHLVALPVEALPPEATSNLNDINDAYVAGCLNLKTFDSIFPGATPLTGWESVLAQSIFSTREESLDLIYSQADTIPDEDSEVGSLFVDSLSALKEAWVKLPYQLQLKYIPLKDALKNALIAT